MIINENYNKNNTKIIAEKYLSWLNTGISENDILVLTYNSASKKNIINSVLKNTSARVLSDVKIMTFKGLIYNSISDNWAELGNKIKNSNHKIIPCLSGLETSQYLLKQIIREENVKGYNSKKSLLHQIFRRYSLIVNNKLSPDEVKKKSKILGEAFGDDADNIIKKFILKTLELRAFDNIRQSQIFSYIYKNTDYFKNIKYLICDNMDEATPLFLDFIKTISPQLKDKLIIIDKDGGSRCGYLCAEPNASDILENIFNEKIIDDTPEKPVIAELKKNIFNDEQNKLQNIFALSLSKRVEMAEVVVRKINTMLKAGISPKDISVITPIQDSLLKFTFKTELKKCRPLFISGSEKLIDNPLVKAVITVLKMSLCMPVEEYEMRVILIKYLNLSIKDLDADFENKLADNEIYNEFCKHIDFLRNSNLSLSEKAYKTYLKFVNKINKSDLAKFNFFLKELQEFETIFKDDKTLNFDEGIITQIENSIISDNPYSVLEPDEDELIISTPQKIIDNSIKTKYQFWLDTSSMEWVKSDIGPLYNSWVFQKNWDKDEYTIEDNISLAKEKVFKILRKLILNTETIFSYSSLFDTQGAENFGGIEKYIVPDGEETEKTEAQKSFNITPREDQKPVLEYSSGDMAISAVPGAGKTTILLALVIKLLSKDIDPENIWVLTYMDSAARNFKERIKNTGTLKMPNISTIHGLALRILKENSNYERLGLNPDFDICDDTRRGGILKSIQNSLDKQEFDEFDRAISVLKLSVGFDKMKNNPQIHKLINLKKGNYAEIKLSKFLNFFANYQKKLEIENLIDYDDILILAVELLEKNKDILEYYQDICQYIIEDEAQDSSSVQQRLINLLSAKYKNLIRCGDINQAITSTFTNADIKGFREFIEKADLRVDMNCSQRCAEGIWKLANRVLKWGNENDFTPFYEIMMNPVEGKNPAETDSVKFGIYKNETEEKISIVKTIKNILEKQPNATVGILLRNNHQVNNWADFVNSSGLTAITRNECLGQKKIFRVIFSVLNSISKPYDNFILSQTYKSLAESGFLALNYDKFIYKFGDKNRDLDEFSKLFSTTENLPHKFISLNNDDILEPNLAKFHWDMNYWLSFPELSISELATMIGLYYFSQEIERSNIHLISTLCSKLYNGNFNQTLQKLSDLSKRPNLSGFKFFSEDEESDFSGGKIQIMTMHKSKGDEFDYVFLPELTEKNLNLDISQYRLKKNSDFTENIKALNGTYIPKSEKELKEFFISENYRLLYVAITRAKSRLYISYPRLETSFGQQRDSQPNMVFDLSDDLSE